MSKRIASRKFKLALGRIIFVMIIFYVLVLFWDQRKLRKNLEAKRAAYQVEIIELEEGIEELEDEIENSDSLKFIEKIAREELGMVKPREIIVIDKNQKGIGFPEEKTQVSD